LGSFRAFRRKMAAERKIEDPLDKVAVTCYIHFGNQNPLSISCETCLDFKQKNCSGQGFRGNDCLRCMSKHSESAIIATNFF
jgi:hypothetical protein